MLEYYEHCFEASKIFNNLTGCSLYSSQKPTFATGTTMSYDNVSFQIAVATTSYSLYQLPSSQQGHATDFTT